MTLLFIVSTVGTSLLSNAIKSKPKDVGHILNETANLKEEELKPEYKKVLLDLKEEVQQKLLSASSTQEARRLSAELNGILGYYDNQKPDVNDIHYLISTDTFQGRLTAQLVKEYLHQQGVKMVEIFTPSGLSTANTQSFSRGIKEIIKWCDETVEGFRGRGYRVVFNLVGGFKSLQGFMNTLGMFYADEIIYIFEASTADLIRIPRLPVRMEIESVLREKASLFAMMEKGYIAKPNEVTDVPEIYLDKDDDGYATLSEWGLLVWNENKKEILGAFSLEDLEFPGLRYENSFLKDFDKISEKKRRADIISTLAEVSVIYRKKGVAGLKSHGGLQYANYAGRNDGMAHFRLNLGWRVSCIEKDGCLFLSHVGPHDINENP